MAGTFSDFLESKLLRHTFGATSFTPTTAHWVALFSTASGLEAGTSTAEISGNAYARVVYQNTTGNWTTGNAQTNTATITFPVATGTGWGSVTHMAFVSTSASTSPDYYCWADLTTPKTIDGGDTASFAISAISIALD